MSSPPLHAQIGSMLCVLLYTTSFICSLAAAGKVSPTLPGTIPKNTRPSKAITASLVLVSSSFSLVPLPPSAPSYPCCFFSVTLFLLFLTCFALCSCSCVEEMDFTLPSLKAHKGFVVNLHVIRLRNRGHL